MKSGLKNLLAKLARSSVGSILPMTAAAIFVLAGMIGGGIDVSRGYMVKNRLQNACDAATLAGRRAIDINGFDNAAQAQARLYFNTNFDPGEEDVSASNFTATTPDGGNTIDGTATATLPTIVMQLFGYTQTHLSATCSASMSVGNSDVVMVLDVTGSMGDDIDIDDGSSSSGGYGHSHTDTEEKIVALQDAMKNFYKTVAGATAGSNARVRYGFVPYSSSVNLKYLLTNTSSDTGDAYIDTDYIADTWPIQSRQADFLKWNTTSTSSPANPQFDSDWSGYSNESASKCPSTSSWQNNGSLVTNTSKNPPTQTQSQKRKVYQCKTKNNKLQSEWRYEYQNVVTQGSINSTGSGSFFQWEYKQITYDVSSYKDFNRVSTRTGNNGASVSSTWDGCIEERTPSLPATGFEFDADNGIVPDDRHYNPDSDKAWDLDIDAAPGATESGYGTAPKWGLMWPEVAYLRSSSSSAASYCPYEARPLMTMSKNDFDDYADELEPVGSTYHDIGMIWGARLASPQGIFAPTVNASPSNGGKVARHLIFMTDGDMDTSTSIQSSWGIESLDRRVTTNGSKSTSDSNHAERFRAICDAIKAKGIRIWVIAFSNGLNDDLSYCASSNSGFTANTSDQLNSAFQVIAKNVGELRVVT